ncbi:MAG TPA: M14 family zinc carboxypeptidase [Gaiellaceae bacterium]|nr:M14 family zinc carboxypeptidase [Gaiellaceae bacterium]
MRRWVLFFGALLIVLAFSAVAHAQGKHGLQLYTTTTDAATAARLATEGYDVASIRERFAGVEIDLVLTAGERGKLARQGLKLRVVRDGKGRSQTQRFVAQAANGFEVWRSWDEPGGIRDELYELARKNPQLVKLEVLGHSPQGREYVALKVTQGARGKRDGIRPAVLYVSTFHAREWISTEVNRRLLHWYVDHWRANDKAIRKLLRTTELWFVLVHNPDGYQYTFDAERLWRKNLRDNNENGVVDAGDGVDLNRNLPEHWGWDEEGSSSQASSETYRGPAPASESETQAIMALHDRVPFRFAISYHSFGDLLLYPQGWQVQTPSADDPIYVALTGTDAEPAVPGFDPGPAADLYITNGEYTDWAHAEKGALSWTPELSQGCPGCGFVFPDNEQLVQEHFEENLDFAVRVAKSAGDPDDPVSHFGVDTAGLYLNVSTIDPWKTNHPSSDLAVEVSYAGGSSQTVEVLAKRAVGDVTLRYRVNGGPEQTALTAPAPDGERFGGNNAYNTYYHYLRSEIPGLAVGDEVEYWFTAGGEASEHATFPVVEDADADVLILAAEDRTGAVNLPGYASTSPETPNYLSYYEAALAANGVSYDVYDTDAMGRKAPEHLGVLSHYDAVVWYSGNDLVPRELGPGPGNASRIANDLMLHVRAYLNEGGKLLYTGQWAGALENGVAGNQFYDPVADEQCVVGGVLVLDRCQLIADKDDFLQYWLGAYVYNSDGGTDPSTGEPFSVAGIADPYSGLGWGFNGVDTAANQIHTASFLTTSSILKPDEYPQFASHASAIWETGAAGGFEPYDGSFYVYSNTADVTYKRLLRPISVPAGGGEMTFRFSYDTEPDWDFVFVEIHDVAAGTWVTAPDLNGHTSTDTGESCPAGWFELHPWLEQYQGADCSGAGWNAASGRSSGWEEWRIDLTPYAGKQIEVSISYASDWAVQGLGAFADLINVPGGDGSTSFETGLDGWTVPGPPAGSAANANDWELTGSVGFEEGAVVATEDTLYFGFGFEGITGASTRNAVMGRALDYLLGP